jgi:MFS family permease
MAMTAWLLDTRPLRIVAFRRLWIGGVLSGIGNQMTVLAVTLQIFGLVRTPLAVGAIGLFTAAPAVIVALAGGTLGDAIDRKKLTLFVTCCQAIVSIAFTAQAFAGAQQIVLLYGLVSMQFLFGSIGAPATRTIVPRLVPKDQIAAATALRQFGSYVCIVIGPPLAGFVASLWGVKIAYALDVMSFAASLYALAMLPSMPPESGSSAPGLRAFIDGMRYVRGNAVILGALLADLSVTLFGVPVALLPALNADRLGGSPFTLGLLAGAPAIGGLVASIFSGPVSRISARGRAMLVGCILWGLATAGLGLVTRLWSAMVLLIVAGAIDASDVILRSTMVQLTVAEGYRGRVLAAEYVVDAASPQLGSFRGGVIGSLVSPPFSAVAGGLSTVVVAALIALLVPSFVRRSDDKSQHPSAR